MNRKKYNEEEFNKYLTPNFKAMKAQASLKYSLPRIEESFPVETQDATHRQHFAGYCLDCTVKNNEESVIRATNNFLSKIFPEEKNWDLSNNKAVINFNSLDSLKSRKGRPDFILKRTVNQAGVSPIKLLGEAKKCTGNIDDAIIQASFYLAAHTRTYGVDTFYGFATTYRKWIFIQYLLQDNRISVSEEFILLKDARLSPDEKTLQKISSILHGLTRLNENQ